MTTFLLLLLVLAAVALAATLRSLADGGHGHAPASHVDDPRFGPPGRLLG